MQQVFLFSLLAGTATVIGSLFVLYRAGGGRANLYRLMAFASGVLLGAAFVHLVPEAIERGSHPAAWGLVIGFVAFFALEQVTFSHACPEYCEDCPVHPVGLVAFAALTLHSLVDGLVLAAGFGASAGLGLVASTKSPRACRWLLSPWGRATGANGPSCFPWWWPWPLRWER